MQSNPPSAASAFSHFAASAAPAPQALRRAQFTPAELRLFLCGRPRVNLADLKPLTRRVLRTGRGRMWDDAVRVPSRTTCLVRVIR